MSNVNKEQTQQRNPIDNDEKCKQNVFLASSQVYRVWRNCIQCGNNYQLNRGDVVIQQIQQYLLSQTESSHSLDPLKKLDCEIAVFYHLVLMMEWSKLST